MSAKTVELISIEPTLVNRLLETNNIAAVQATVSELAQSLESICPDIPVYPFLIVVTESLLPPEVLRQEAVNSLVSQQQYYQALHKEIKNKTKSLADYLNLVLSLAVVQTGNQFLVKVITYHDREEDEPKRLSLLSKAGDGDFWRGLENNKIKTMMPLDPIYGTNHHPVISLSELGIEPKHTEVLLSAYNQLFNQFSDLFSKIVPLLAVDGEILQGVKSLSGSNAYNPASVGMALFRVHNDFDKVDRIYDQFRQRFNDYVTEEEWTIIFSSLQTMDQELGKLIEIGETHIKDT